MAPLRGLSPCRPLGCQHEELPGRHCSGQKDPRRPPTLTTQCGAAGGEQQCCNSGQTCWNNQRCCPTTGMCGSNCCMPGQTCCGGTTCCSGDQVGVGFGRAGFGRTRTRQATNPFGSPGPMPDPLQQTQTTTHAAAMTEKQPWNRPAFKDSALRRAPNSEPLAGAFAWLVALWPWGPFRVGDGMPLFCP
jgi:hypothetical protein